MTATSTDHARTCLELAPTDWFRAPWRNTPPLPRPPAPPFDREKTLRKITNVTETYVVWRDKRICVPPFPSREESHFWLVLGGGLKDQNNSGKHLYEAMSTQLFAGDLSEEQAFELFLGVTPAARSWQIAAVSVFCPPDALVRLLIAYDLRRGEGDRYADMSFIDTVLDGLGQYVIPYLTPEERREIGAQIRPHLRVEDFPYMNRFLRDSYRSGPIAFYLAALFGGSEDVLGELVSRWQDNVVGSDPSALMALPLPILLGLGDPATIIREGHRLGIFFRDAQDIRWWMAATDGADMSYLQQCVRDRLYEWWRIKRIHEMFYALLLEISPATAVLALELDQDAYMTVVTRVWLDTHVEEAIAGIVPLAGADHAMSAPALAWLRRYVRRGHAALIERHLGALPPEQAERIRAQSMADAAAALPPFDERDTPAWLAEAAAGAPLAKATSWLQLPDLPPLVVGDHRLSPGQVSAVVGAIQASPLGVRPPLVDLLRRHATAASCEAFAWAIFEEWLAARGPSKDKWGIGVLVQLGGDTALTRLTSLIGEWPTQGQHPRALLGIDCLRMVGSDIALMQLNNIAQKMKYLGLRKRAAQHMDAIASERGLSREDLEDRIVPDCGLDAGGGRVFDYGPRQFRFALGADMKPALRDDRGRPIATLPRPTAKDDLSKAERANAEWKLLRKQVALVAKVQAARLELAMVSGRRWSCAAFDLLLVRHPLMGHLAQRLVWAAYDPQGQLAATFRVDEGRRYADCGERAVDLAPFASVGLPHPLALAEAERFGWADLLADYGLIQPFPQIARPTFALEPSEHGQCEIRRFNHLAIPAARLVFGLEKRGWARSEPGEGACFSMHARHFPTVDITAIVYYHPGVVTGGVPSSEDQHVSSIAFAQGCYRPRTWELTHPEQVPLAQVPRVVLSEVLADVAAAARPT